MNRYYFDHNATTPVAREVLDAMLPMMTEVYGNASSIHYFGQTARKRLDDSRRAIGKFLGASPGEIVYTSGGTEADNLAILGIAAGGHAVTTTIEHPAVLASCAQLESTQVPVDSRGVVDPDDIRKAIRPNTKIISVMHANNETGVIQPIAEIACIAHGHGITMHSDGVQVAGKMTIDVDALGVDLYSISGHKIYAPKGIGALYVRAGTKLTARMHGGHHERDRRAGTENVAGAVALGRAAEWAMQDGPAEWAREVELRDRLERSILDRVTGTHVNGAGAERTPNTTNIRFDGIDAEPLLIALDLKGFAVSSGSACSSGAAEPSHVLTAIGLSKEQAKSSVRFSLGRSNTAEQVDALIDAVIECVAHVRKMAPAYA
ncbi:MAG TPA: cysteine desulfurase family protein [Bryobacteraceae bacterium]|nr:cysteine desulfurase family protein [Bryobacteraceae bacterium]